MSRWVAVELPDVLCPMPNTLTHDKARAEYKKVRSEMRGVTDSAIRRETARRMGLDYDTFLGAWKKPKSVARPSPSATGSPVVEQAQTLKAYDELLDGDMLPLPDRNVGEKPLFYAFRAMDQARKNRELYAKRGDIHAKIAELASEWTAAHKSVLAKVRREVLDGDRPEIAQAMRNGTKAPDLYRGMRGSDDEFVNMVSDMKVGDSVDLRGVSSFTDDKNWGQTFADNDGQASSVLMTVKNARGLPMDRISNSPGESEWLVTGQLRITRILEDKKNGKHRFVRVEAEWVS